MLQEFVVLKVNSFSKMSNGRSASRLFLGQEDFLYAGDFEDGEENEIPLYRKGINKTFVFFLESERIANALKKGDRILVFVANIREKVYTPEEGEASIQRTINGQLLVSDSFFDRLTSTSTSTSTSKKKPLKKVIKKPLKKAEPEEAPEEEVEADTKTEDAPF